MPCYSQSSNLSASEVELLNRIEASAFSSNFKFNTNEVTSFRPYFDDLLEIEKKISPNKITKKTVILDYYIGNLYYYVYENYVDALTYLNRVYLNENYLTDAIKLSLYIVLADSENAQSNFIKSIFFYNESVKLAKRIGDNFEYYRATREIGVRHRNVKNYVLAKTYLDKAKDLQNTYNISGVNPIWLLIHYANMYRSLKKYNFAKYVLKQALVHPEIKNYPKMRSYIYIEYASVWEDLGHLDSVAFYSKKIIEETTASFKRDKKKIAFDERYDKWCLIPAYRHLGDLALLKKDTLKAVSNFYKSVTIGNNISITLDGSISAKKLIQISKNNDTLIKPALKLLKTYHKNRSFYKQSSLTSAKIDEKIAKMTDVKQEVKFASFQNYFLLILIVLFVLLCYFTYLIYKNYKIFSLKNKMLNNLNLNMEKTTEQLNQTHKDLDHFSSLVSNDITTSVTKIKRNLEKIVTLAVNPNKIKSYDKLSSDSLKLSFLISNLLKTTLTTKKAKIKAEHINLLEVLDLVQTSLKNNIILLEPQINYASSLPSFYGFKVQIYQLLKNLIENALKYSHPNREPIINISFTKENRSLTIIIEDNGIGVPERKQKEIFYLFSQSRQFDMSKGMGMGLNICKKIVTSYRGQIRLESTEGKGCKFIITLKELKEK